MQTKEEVRSFLKQQARLFPSASFILEDKASAQALLHSPSYRQCSTLFAFSPLSDEVDITPVLEDALKAKRLALPRCIGDTLEFVFVEKGWSDRAKPSSLGVEEPLDGPLAIPDEHSLILVPAMAYTDRGERLGRGKGFYDRYLAQYPSSPTMGICRSYQLLKKLPAQSWDRQVREVLCNGTVYRT